MKSVLLSEVHLQVDQPQTQKFNQVKLCSTSQVNIYMTKVKVKGVVSNLIELWG